MTDPTPEEPWVAGYRTAMTGFLLKHGTLVSAETDQRYGWIATDYDHPRTCPLTLTEGGTFREETIWEFEGTFAGVKDRVVIDASPVSCACGAITDRIVRYDGTLSDLLTEFLGGITS